MAAIVARGLLTFASVRHGSCRVLLRRNFPLVVSANFSTSVVVCGDKDSQEDMDQLKGNPYFNKYADKIAKLQKTSPDDFLKRLGDLEAKAKTGAPGTSSAEKEREFSLPTKPKTDLKGGSISLTKEKKLGERVRTELLLDKSAEEIASIWREYHSTKDALAAVIPAATYDRMKERFQEFKTFLFPLPRKEGYEFVVVQFEGNEAHFTTLINYQAHGANSPECLTLIHYPDLAETKGIVLMVGEFDTNVLGAPEAQCLANELELYYAKPTPERLRLLQTFTASPSEFRHMDLVAQMESVTLLAEGGLGQAPKKAISQDGGASSKE